MKEKYYNGDILICACVQCYEDFLLRTLEGTVAFYMSFNYRYTDAHCPDCLHPECPRSLFHGSDCQERGSE